MDADRLPPADDRPADPVSRVGAGEHIDPAFRGKVVALEHDRAVGGSDQELTGSACALRAAPLSD